MWLSFAKESSVVWSVVAAHFSSKDFKFSFLPIFINSTLLHLVVPFLKYSKKPHHVQKAVRRGKRNRERGRREENGRKGVRGTRRERKEHTTRIQVKGNRAAPSL